MNNERYVGFYNAPFTRRQNFRQAKMKTFADDKLQGTPKTKSVLDTIENIEGDTNKRAKMALDGSHEFFGP